MNKMTDEELETFSKEKQALDELYDVAGNIKNLNEDYIILKSALQRLESIDNTNPSEALECLDGIEYVADVLKVNHKIGSRDIANQEIKEMAARLYYRIPTIKQALLKAQEQEKENIKYKSLEEEIGCPLEVVIKAVKQGKVWNGYTWFLNMKLTFVNDVWVLSNGVYIYALENYAKDPRKFDSWWLKEDKSE